MNKRFEGPYRLGKKQKRAVLDKNGLEVVIFPVGNEYFAEFLVIKLNEEYEKINVPRNF